mgnify:CR=1 FL=1
MTDAEEEALTERLKELKQSLEDHDFAKVVEICEHDGASLFQTTTTTNASLQVMLYEIYAKALLQQEEISKLVESVKPPNAEVRALLEPLQAYAKYRLGHYNNSTSATHTSSSSSIGSTGTMVEHVQAQSKYRLHETKEALQGYEKILQQLQQPPGDKAEEGQDQDEITAEVLTNALAVIIANSTPYSGSIADDKELHKWMAKAEAYLKENCHNNSAHELHDLMYNLATLQLLSSHGASERQKARALLHQAQRKCAVIAEDEGKEELEPILLQQAWSGLFWGDHHHSSSSPSLTGDSNSSSKHYHSKLNGLLAHINPLLGQLQQQGSNNSANSKLLLAFLEKLSTSQDVKLTPVQQRLIQYNSAVLHLHEYRNTNNEDHQVKGRLTLDALSQSILNANSSKAKKKKNNVSVKTIISTLSELDTLWWQVRIDVLQAYLYSTDGSENKTEKEWKHIYSKLQDRRKTLEESIQQQHNLQDDNAGEIDSHRMRQHILLYLDLHLHNLDQKKEEDFLKVHQDFPACTASLAHLYSQQGNSEKAQALLSEHGADNMVAEMAMAQGNYQKAVELYEGMLTGTSSDKEQLVYKAKLVEALSHIDPEQACQQWKNMNMDSLVSMDVGSDDDLELDAQALEMRELPRLQRNSHNATASYLVGLDATAPNANGEKRRKKSRNAVMRRRAKQRQKYLEQLQEKGVYSLSKPVPPDPERWIPKAERQRRGRRRGPSNAYNKSSQGSGYSTKDADQLDVAARVSGQVEVKAHSTAHMSVVGGDRKGGRRRWILCYGSSLLCNHGCYCGKKKMAYFCQLFCVVDFTTILVIKFTYKTAYYGYIHY